MIIEKKGKFTFDKAMDLLPGPEGKRFATIFKRGELLIEIYAPRGVDPQQPHTRDEIYVVIQGGGYFVNGDTRGSFAVGDVLFVPAGVVHRFEEFTDDFATWVIFYGPEGGDKVEG